MVTSRCGFVALLGKPNAGKSTLLNALVGQKVVGVSAKPQTTRNKILGICIEEKSQILFLDTPGMHDARGLTRLNAILNKEAWSTLADAHLICYLTDITEIWTHEDSMFFSKIVKGCDAKVVVLATKYDKIKMVVAEEKMTNLETILRHLIDSFDEKDKAKLVVREPILISAKRAEMVQSLKQLAVTHLPEGEWLYPEENLTDRSQSFVCTELIREKVFRFLGEELPYHSTVRIDKFEGKPNVVVIFASIIVSRNSQKGMVVGKKGAKIKEIGEEARKSLEQHLGKKVFLDLQVMVDEDWINRDRSITEYTQMESQ